MVPILLLDCSEALQTRLYKQGFDVESGTSGFCTGVRKLPSQVYEKSVVVFNPENIDLGFLTRQYAMDVGKMTDTSPQFSLDSLKKHMAAGATVLVFVNHLSDELSVQQWIYHWIPYMPAIRFTHDKRVVNNKFEMYPQSKAEYLAPVVTLSDLSLPVLQMLLVSQEAERDFFPLFWNLQDGLLGVMLPCGKGKLIVLPKFQSNDDVIETFLLRVVPELYEGKQRYRLADVFISPDEVTAQNAVDEFAGAEVELRKRHADARVALTTTTRVKVNVLKADATAKQIEIYYDCALRQDDVALYYLYKIVEAVENKFGGEAAGIEAVGQKTAWKAVKKLANETYRDARHAPKPTDVITKWTNAEIAECFENVQKIVFSYFDTLFPSS